MSHKDEGRCRFTGWLDVGLVASIVTIVAFAAAAYGGVEAWSFALLSVLGALVALLGVARLACGDTAGPRAPLWLFVAFVAFSSLQAVPLPGGVASLVSPQRFAATTDSADAAASVSYYPRATLLSVRNLLVALTVFAVSAVALRRSQSVKVLLLGLFVVGCAQSALAVAQLATGAEGIYWAPSDPIAGGAWAGSFVNHSNFCQFLNVTLGAGIGYLLVAMSENRHRSRRRLSSQAAATRYAAVLGGLALHAVAIATSLSRGGMLGMLVGSVVVAAMLSRGKRLRKQSWTLFVVPGLAFALLAVFGFDVVYDRLASLKERDSYTERLELTAATLRCAADHPIFGTGLGTHAFVFPGYDTTGSVDLAEQADNDYAQLAEETGLVGVALVAALVVSLVLALRRALVGSRHSIRYAAYGVAYAAAALAVQSVSDFGLRLPAVYCAAAALAGVGFVVSRSAARVEPSGGRVALALGCLLVAGPIWCWAVAESKRDLSAERWSALAFGVEERIDSAPGVVDPRTRLDLVAAAEQAASIRPGDVEYAYWLNVYRWRLLTSDETQTAAVVTDPDGREFASQVADGLRAARRLCPTYGPAAALEGRIRLALGDEQAPDLIRRAARLAPNDPTVLLTLAELSAAEGESDDAVRQTLVRVVGLDGAYIDEATTILVDQVGRPDWARDLAAGEPDLLRALATQLKSRGDDFASLIEELYAEATDIAEQRVLDGRAPPDRVADLARRKAEAGDGEAAARYYRMALVSEFGNLSWRLALIEVLQRDGRYQEAYDEAKTCLRLRPDNVVARTRLEKLSRLLPAEEPLFELQVE